jgi:hypothetical protein
MLYYIARCVKATSPTDARELALRFSKHKEDGLWNLIPVTEALLRRTSALMVSGFHTHRRCSPSRDGTRDRRTYCVDQ